MGRISQVLQGCASWNISWKERLPSSLRGSIGDGAHLVVFDSYMGRSDDVLEGFRSDALFEGVMTSLSSGGCSGYEMSWSLQQPSGPGPASVYAGSSSLFQEYCEDVLDGINGLDFDTNGLAGFNGLFAGIFGPAAGPGTVTPEPLAARSRIDALVASATEYRRRFGAGEQLSWRMYPGFRMRADFTTELFSNGSVVISDLDTQERGSGGLLNVPASINVTRDISNILTDIYFYGDRNASTGVTPVENYTNLAPFNSHNGVPFESRTIVDDGGSQSGMTSAAIKKANDSAFVRSNVDVKLTRDPWLKEVSPGDEVYVYSPHEPDLVDSANSVDHFGRIQPKKFFVQEMSRSITPTMSVYLRNPVSVGAAKWNDVTDYVQCSTAPASVKLTDFFIAPYQKSASGGFRRLGDELKVAQRLSRSSN